MTTDRRWVAGSPPGCVALGPRRVGGPGGAAGPKCPLRSCKSPSASGAEVVGGNSYEMTPGPRGGVHP